MDGRRRAAELAEAAAGGLLPGLRWVMQATSGQRRLPTHALRGLRGARRRTAARDSWPAPPRRGDAGPPTGWPRRAISTFGGLGGPQAPTRLWSVIIVGLAPGLPAQPARARHPPEGLSGSCPDCGGPLVAAARARLQSGNRGHSAGTALRWRSRQLSRRRAAANLMLPTPGSPWPS